MDRRYCPLEVRSLNNTNVISGYALVFYDPADPAGTEYQHPGTNTFERIERHNIDIKQLTGARSLVCLWNHQDDNLLGTLGENLTVKQDDRGLYYECELPDTTLGRDIGELVRRNLVKGSSFGSMMKPAVYHREGSKLVRTVRGFDILKDIGPVAVPCFPATGAVSYRSIDDEIQAWERTQELIERIKNLTPRD